MKYETIEACFAEMVRREPKRFNRNLANMIHVSDRFGGNYYDITKLTIDDMYAILEVIGYTMWAVDCLTAHGIVFQGQWRKIRDKDIWGFAYDSDYVPVQFDLPDPAFKPAFLAALNHYLE